MSDSETEPAEEGTLRRWLRAPTILDLSIALSLIAILSAIAIPTFFSRPKVTLDHAAILLANDMRYAQNEAALCGMSTRVKFDPSGDGYAIQYSNGKAIANPIGGADLVRSYSFDAIFRGVRIASLDGVESVEFDRNGFASQGLELELQYEEGTRVLRMERGSGLVTIEGLESDWVDDGL